jgi:hypothetical protein
VDKKEGRNRRKERKEWTGDVEGRKMWKEGTERNGTEGERMNGRKENKKKDCVSKSRQKKTVVLNVDLAFGI